MPAETLIQLRRGTAAQWTSTNPVLGEGEQGLETDTLRTKIGDGSSAWSALEYSESPNSSPVIVHDAHGNLMTITYANGTTKAITYTADVMTQIDHDVGTYTIRRVVTRNANGAVTSIAQTII